MISKYKKGWYKLSVIVIVLILGVSLFLLSYKADKGSSVKPSENTELVAYKKNPSELKIARNNDTFRWFTSLDRALAYSKFNFKVPDYLPKGYQLDTVALTINFTKANYADLSNNTSIYFVHGKDSKRMMEVLASKGKGSLLEHQLLWGVSYAEDSTQPPTFQQRATSIGHVKGTLYTGNRKWNYSNRKLTGNSFVWQDGDVSYAVNYFSEYVSQEELANIVQSFVLPNQAQHVRYDGEGSSFPLYDQKDLLEAKKILGFKVKFPYDLPDTHLEMIYSSLLRTSNPDVAGSFGQTSDALFNEYRAQYNSNIYEMNDDLYYYQSKAPLFNVSKLSFIRKIDVKGIQVSAYADKGHVYFGPFKDENNPNKFKNQIYYSWKQDGIYYAAAFIGMDKYQEKNLESLILAPLQ